MFEKAEHIVRELLVWDNVWPVAQWCGNGYERLEDFRSAGWNILSLTIAGDDHDIGEAFQRIAAARSAVDRLGNCLLVDRFEDIEHARAAGQLAVTLHFEGTRTFGRNLDVVESFRKLGVTHNLLAFNKANCAAGGCMEASDGGLTNWGRRLIAEMERVGMIVDLSHCGRRSTLDALAIAARPMIFSHSNAEAVAAHPRNLTGEQIRACAATGGLVGLSGSSGYLGDETASTEAMFAHLDHVVNLVGIDHVGIGLDIVFDPAPLNDWIRGRPDEWPVAADPAWPGFRFARLGQLAELVDRMCMGGYGETDIRKFLGGNYLRISREVWK